LFGEFMLQAFGHRVIARCTENERNEAGGIAIADSVYAQSHRKPLIAEVTSVGEKVSDLRVHDTILVPKYEGNIIEWEGEDYLICDEKSILAEIISDFQEKKLDRRYNDWNVRGNIAEGVGSLGNYCVRPRNHWLYCRLGRRPESVNGIYIPDKSRDICNWLDILALATAQSLPRPNPCHEDEPWWGIPKCYDVGDMVMVPDDHPWGIKRSRLWWDCELFIDESVVRAAYVEP